MIKQVKWSGPLNCNIEVGRSRTHLKVNEVCGQVVVDERPVIVLPALIIGLDLKVGYHLP